jgi:hypothetical protein
LTKQTFIAALRECSNIDEVGWMTLCEKLWDLLYLSPLYTQMADIVDNNARALFLNVNKKKWTFLHITHANAHLFWLYNKIWQ